MIQINAIQSALLNLIGWQQTFDTTDLKVPEHLTHSESGLYYQQFHPLLTIANLNCVAPDFKNISYPEFDSTANYKEGQVVSNTEGILYRAKQNVPPGSSLADEIYWGEIDPFGIWLEEKTKASIMRAVNRFIVDKANKGAYKSIFENKTIIDGTGRLTDLEQNKNNLVGFELVTLRSKGVTTKINKIGLQFTKPGNYTIYIMHSSSLEPVYTLQFTKQKAGSVEWFNLQDVYLPYESKDFGPGGSWYLCYNQNELPEGSQAIKNEFDLSKGPCSSCSRASYINWQLWTKHLEVHPFYVNNENIDYIEGVGPSMWDIENNLYIYKTNFGINLDITVSCDITEFIINQRTEFTDVIGKQLAVDMLREFAFNANVRTNRHSINASKIDILYEVDGDSSSIKKSGLSHQLDEAFKALEIQTEGIDRVCLPCKNNGIRFKTI